MQKSGKKDWKAMQSVSLKAGKSLLDMADLVLDYVKPSKVADTFMLLTIGETTEQSYRKAISHIEQSVVAQQKVLDGKIQKYMSEMKTLYGRTA